MYAGCMDVCRYVDVCMAVCADYRLLLDAGCNVNAPDLDGWRPLHAAVHWGQTEAVELLCDALADLDALNAVGQTPADLADPSIRPLLDEMRRKHQNRHNRKRK
ncbi:hypothetical protein HAZT_HAZT000888 [Hyalella azteca]|uniref:Uncharacterized protein n=1 Tax=Hyalella azteca TaxID=294128 RepID=A0A6A0GYF3_HYAAZ|nr:hypothetical protein HAZT_HAZT000888 [Hyalella azteca]